MSESTYYIRQLPRDGRELDLTGLHVAVYERDSIGSRIVAVFRSESDATLFLACLSDLAGYDAGK